MCPRAPRTRAADDGLGGPAAHQVCVDSSSAAAAHADDLRGHRTMAVSRSSWNSAGATPAAASGLRSLWLAPRPVSRAPRAPDATAHSRAAVAPAPARVCPSNAESECVALASLARAYRITSRSTRGLNCYFGPVHQHREGPATDQELLLGVYASDSRKARSQRISCAVCHLLNGQA